MEMSYLRGACGVTRWDGESNESVYKKCGMGSQANGVNLVRLQCRSVALYLMGAADKIRQKSKENVQARNSFDHQ